MNAFEQFEMLKELEAKKDYLRLSIIIAKKELEDKTNQVMELYDELQKTQFKINGLTIL